MAEFTRQREYFAAVPHSFLRFSPRAIKLYIALDSFCWRKTGTSKVSRRELVKNTGMSARWITKATAELVEAGAIKYHDGAWTKRIYDLSPAVSLWSPGGTKSGSQVEPGPGSQGEPYIIQKSEDQKAEVVVTVATPPAATNGAAHQTPERKQASTDALRMLKETDAIIVGAYGQEAKGAINWGADRRMLTDAIIRHGVKKVDDAMTEALDYCIKRKKTFTVRRFVSYLPTHIQRLAIKNGHWIPNAI